MPILGKHELGGWHTSSGECTTDKVDVGKPFRGRVRAIDAGDVSALVCRYQEVEAESTAEVFEGCGRLQPVVLMQRFKDCR